MKVVLLSFAYPEVCASLANALADREDVTLLLPQSLAPRLPRGLNSSVRLVTFASPRLRQPVKQLRASLDILRAIRAADADVVHVQQGQLWFNPLMRFVRPPVVLTVHDAVHHPGDRRSRMTPQWVMNQGFRQADGIVVHAGGVSQQLIAAGIDPAIIEVIPHPAIGPVDQAPASSDDVPVVLFFGRIWPYKGLEHLIRCEPMLAEDVPGVRIVIAGEGEDFDRYRRMMTRPERYEVHDRYVSDAERGELFRRASVVVLPYVEASQSGVVPVAYAHGRPVVATTVGGLPEAVRHDETGLLVPPGDPVALAAAIGRILADPGLRDRLGEGGRRVLETEWSAAAMADRTVAAFRRAIERARGGATPSVR